MNAAERTTLEVVSRIGVSPGWREGDVVGWEFVVADDPALLHRVFVLLDEHVQLHQPIPSRHNGWPLAQEGWWYVDLVRTSFDDDGRLVIEDRWLDVIVPPDQSHSMKVRDLDELGDAMKNGVVSLEDAAEDLVRFQTFLDRHLTPHRTAPAAEWPDWPPSSLRPFLVL